MQSAEPDVVRVVPTRLWHALVDDEVAGKAYVRQRPDRRYFVAVDAWRDEVFHALLDAVVADLPHPLSTRIGEADEEELARWTGRGFEPLRREDEYEMPLDGAAPGAAPVPAGYSLVPAPDADLDELRRLDDELRQDVPGARGWVNDPEEFAEQVLRSPLVDPETSLVAVDDATGAYAGLARLWVATNWARVGLVGVRHEHRRRGLGRALLAAAVRPLPGRGVRVVVAETDAEDAAAQALLAGFGARRVAGVLELGAAARR